MTPDSVLRDRVVLGHTLLEHGRAGEAERVLVESLPLVTTVGAHPNAFLTLRLLGQCARTAGRLDQARGYYSRALDVAEALGDPDLAGAAVSGMAYVELAADDLARADGYFRQAVQLVRTVAPGPGRVAVLRDYADLLVRTGDLRAAAFYQEALDQPGIDPADRAAMLVALGRELYRRGRTAAGLDRLRAAATLLTEAGPDAEAYNALVLLAGLARETDPATAADAFVRAHDLAQTLYGGVDVRHYTEGYAARVRQVEAETQRRADAGELPAVAPPALLEATRNLGPDAVRTVAVGAPAMIGARSLTEGENLLADHRYSEADEKLRMAAVMWSALGAGHVLPQVWSAQGRLELARGDDDAAWALLDRARSQAAALGDARTELTALVALSELLATAAEPRPPAGEVRRELRLLDVVVRARSLASYLGETLPASVDTAAAVLCERYRAHDLAERHLRAALAAAERAPAIPLARLVAYLARRGDGAGVAALRGRLVAVAEGSTDPSVRAAVDGALGRIDAAAGDWSAATFERLRAACAAHDALRGRAGALDPGMEPPYTVAAEVALRLGRFPEALALVERAETAGAPDAPEAGGDPGDAARVVVFAGDCGVYALTTAPGEPGAGAVVAAGPAVSVSADDPAQRRLAAVVDAAEARSTVALTAAGALYGVPVHRRPDGGARLRVSLLPSASLRAPAPHPVPGGPRPGLVAVDPLDELPFARIAADHAAGRLGVATLGGAAVTAERLAADLASLTVPVVHLACRVVTDERRPERSGLLMAGEAGADRVTPARLAAMTWNGAVVVLNSGEAGGLPPILVRTLLAAGATAVVTTARPVDGLSAALLTTWFHDELDPGVADVAHVDAALLAAQQRLRTATGDDLLTWAADRPVLGADQLAVVTERAESEHPFADPDHWAWWATYGAGAQ
ncbi:tetratricopeptide repeat protein [Cryptosporangium minutisporangium]|uniref:tetratricopeptide repeat protein n=1 Tax=Cryptosporangium minutisporangium TaxID=113569 RepID=UPI0035E7D208